MESLSLGSGPGKGARAFVTRQQRLFVFYVAPGDWAKFDADSIKSLPSGVTDMIVHLAFADEEMKGVTFAHPNWGAEWRQRDFAFVTSDAFRKLLKENNVKLIT